VQGIEPGPDQQVEDQERGELVESADELLGRPASQGEQSESAPQIPEQSGNATDGGV